MTHTTSPAGPPAAVTEQHVEVGGRRLRVLTAGSGPALLYLHGVGDLGAWIPPLARLATAYHVIRPDHPGFNGSDDLAGDDLPDDLRSPADIADVHSRLLDALGIRTAAAVGCSFGGWVATELALRAPDRVSRLVLVDPAGMPAPEPAPRVFDLDPVRAAALTFHGAGLRAAAMARAETLAAADPAAHARDRRNKESARRLAGEPYMHDPDLPERVGALRMPVRVLWGGSDRIIPVSHARAWTAALPHAELAIVPEAGHLPHVEQPEAFFAAAGLEV